MTSENDPSVQELLDHLAKAITAGDGRRVATLWEVPALVLSDEGSHAVASSDEVAAFFGGAREQYTSRGIVDTRADIIRQQWLTERIVVADVRWPWIDAQGREVGEEFSSYTLVRDTKGDLKIRVVVMRGASVH